MKLIYSKSGDLETLIIEHEPSWFRSLFRLPLWEKYQSPAFGIFWYRIHEDGSVSPLDTVFGRNHQIRSLARVARDRRNLGHFQR